jgi:anti-sigma regulatory factor (Ser/Thr protein kinase)
MTTPAWPAVTGYAGHVESRPARPEGLDCLDDPLGDAAEPRVRSSLAAGLADHPATEWPLRSFLELGALDGAVPSARLHSRHMLREWGVAVLGDSAELVVSELVTNGVQASRMMTHAAIRLWLASDGAQVVICVWDASPEAPVRMDVPEDSEHGRGLLLVEAVSEQWGWFPAEPAEPADPWADSRHGKVVWALVS